MKKVQMTVVKADITTLEVDAIVNSANLALLGGGGVDRAIHRNAGCELLLACTQFDGCPPGKSVVMPGFGLSAKYVIHTIGLVWIGGANKDVETLRSCYQTAKALSNRCVLVDQSGHSSFSSGSGDRNCRQYAFARKI